MIKHIRIPRKKKKRIKKELLKQFYKNKPKKCILREFDDEGAWFDIIFYLWQKRNT